jgi:hypothetical protein
MDPKSKIKSTKNNKKEDGEFSNKHVNHDPNAESARAVFGKNDEKEHHGSNLRH